MSTSLPAPREAATTTIWKTYRVSSDEIFRALNIRCPPGAEPEMNFLTDRHGLEIIIKYQEPGP